MEMLYALIGMGFCIFAVGFMLHGFPKITINKHYHESEKKKKNNQ
jgi:hypothetical protein